VFAKLSTHCGTDSLSLPSQLHVYNIILCLLLCANRQNKQRTKCKQESGEAPGMFYIAVVGVSTVCPVADGVIHGLTTQANYNWSSVITVGARDAGWAAGDVSYDITVF